MAVVRPVYFNSGNIQRMDDTMFNSLKNKFRYEFQQASPITLSVVSSGGNLSGLPLTDTRMISGTATNNASRFPNEGETGEPTSVSVNFSRISQSVGSAPSITSDDGKRYFAYIDDNNDIKAMNYGDMLDTLVRPVIDELVSGSNTSNQAGTYFIDTTTSLSANQTLVSSTPVFIDTKANLSAFSTSNIPSSGTMDNPTNANSYYLKKNTMSSPTLGAFPIKIRSDNDLQEFNHTDITNMANELIRNEVISSTGGYKIRYNIGGSGTSKGSGMADTRLTGGSGNYQTRFVNANDYRAQEFPNGTPTTINTYNLRIIKS